MGQIPSAFSWARPNQEPSPKSTDFRAIYPRAPQSLDPHATNDEAAWPVIMASYNRLMTLEPGTAKPLPSLARRVIVSPNGLSYTFVLWEGRTFVDGTLVNSEALFFSFDRLMSSPLGKRYFPYLQSLEILGPFTFRLILTRPWPPFLASLALPQASIVSPSLAHHDPNYLLRNTLGSADYELVSWQNDTITLKARPELTRQPKTATVMFHYEPNQSERLTKALAHQAHLTINPPVLEEESLTVEYKVKSIPTFGVRYLAFNTMRPYTKMKTVRRALATILAETFKGWPGSLESPFPPGLFYLAKSQVKGANSFGIDEVKQSFQVLKSTPPQAPLILIVKDAKDSQDLKDAQLIAKTLDKVGVTCQIMTGSQAQALLVRGEYDLLLASRKPEIPSADMWLGSLLDSQSSASGNPAFFRSQPVDQLITNIVNTVGQAGDGPNDVFRVERERADKLTQLLDVLEAEAPYLFLYQLHETQLIDARLSDMGPHPMWPEVWPVDQIGLKPFSFRSGANPTGRAPRLKEESPNALPPATTTFKLPPTPPEAASPKSPASAPPMGQSSVPIPPLPAPVVPQTQPPSSQQEQLRGQAPPGSETNYENFLNLDLEQ